MSKTHDPYVPVKVELDAALAAKDPDVAAAACRRAQLALARAATGPDFDMRRHRAIATALRELARDARVGRPGSVPPLVTRGAK